MPAQPDPEFVDHVTALLGIASDAINFLVAPSERTDGRLLDPLSLTSDALFRAFAAACDTPIPNGSVCRSRDELAVAIQALLDDAGGVMVKQAHNGAAAGCTVIRKEGDPAPRTAGSRWTQDLSGLEPSKSRCSPRSTPSSVEPDGRHRLVVRSPDRVCGL